MDLFDQLGELAVGSRLKRLSDEIMKDGGNVYKQNNIDFEPKYFPTFFLLHQNKNLTITEIAEKLGVSHPNVIQITKEMEKKSLINSRKDLKDGRKRVVSLSSSSKAMIPAIELIWEDIAKAIHELITEQSTNMFNAILDMEQGLKKESLAERVRKISNDRLIADIEIVEYDPKYASDFQEINYEWIEKYFIVEEMDRKALDNHQVYILDPGGDILFAKYQGEIVGTCALIKVDNERYELSKMGVKNDFRGKKIGKKLGEAIIKKAKMRNAKVIFLDSNKKLTPALKLYESLGFRHVNRQFEESAYQRSNVYMELNL